MVCLEVLDQLCAGVKHLLQRPGSGSVVDGGDHAAQHANLQALPQCVENRGAYAVICGDAAHVERCDLLRVQPLGE